MYEMKYSCSSTTPTELAGLRLVIKYKSASRQNRILQDDIGSFYFSYSQHIHPTTYCHLNLNMPVLQPYLMVCLTSIGSTWAPEEVSSTRPDRGPRVLALPGQQALHHFMLHPLTVATSGLSPLQRMLCCAHVLNAVQAMYINKLSRARCTMERSFGMMETRWRSIFRKRGDRYTCS